MAQRKNSYYVEYISKLNPDAILGGVMSNLECLKNNGIKIAIGSSSKNTPIILKQIGLENYFDAVSDGNNITKSKPDPEVFVKAAQMLGIDCSDCMVVEDADAGIVAGNLGGMTTLSVNGAQGADYFFKNLENDSIYELIKNKCCITNTGDS